jgi:hypothetical protein
VSAKLVRRRRFVAMRERSAKPNQPGLCESRSSRSADLFEQRTHRLLPHDSITSPPPLILLQCKCDFGAQHFFFVGAKLSSSGRKFIPRGESSVLLIG